MPFFVPFLNAVNEERDRGNNGARDSEAFNLNSMAGMSAPALGSSPTIMSVLKTLPGPSSRAKQAAEDDGEGTPGSRYLAPPNMHTARHSPDTIPPQDDDDDDCIFGPLSLGDDTDFLGGSQASNSMQDQMSFMSLR
jgi:hypothetical protein